MPKDIASDAVNKEIRKNKDLDRVENVPNPNPKPMEKPENKSNVEPICKKEECHDFNKNLLKTKMKSKM